MAAPTCAGEQRGPLSSPPSEASLDGRPSASSSINPTEDDFIEMASSLDGVLWASKKVVKPLAEAGELQDVAAQSEPVALTQSSLHGAGDLSAASHDGVVSATEGETSLVDHLERNVVAVRSETREFYKNLNAFFELKQIVESVAARVMPDNAVATKYEDIRPPDDILIQKSVPGGDLSTQLDVLYALAAEAKPKFDGFGRHLVQRIGLEPDAPILEHAEVTWYTYTAVPLKSRERAFVKAQTEYAGDARRLVDIVRASIVVDTEAAFEAVVKCLSDDFVSQEGNGVQVMRFLNRCKTPLPDGQRDVLYNLGMVLNESQSLFVCTLQIHMKQILDYEEATHIPYEYFRSYFKGGHVKAVSERMVLLDKFARRDVDDIAQIVTSALSSDDVDNLEALDEFLFKLSELDIVAAIRRRLLQLSQTASKEVEDDNSESFHWLEYAARLENVATVLKAQVWW